MHQQIRVALRTERARGGGRLTPLLELLREEYSLSVAAYSPLDGDTFVVAVEHEAKAGDRKTEECLALIRDQFDPDAALVELEADGRRDWTWLPHRKGALLDALADLDALDAVEVFVGANGNRFFVQVR